MSKEQHMPPFLWPIFTVAIPFFAVAAGVPWLKTLRRRDHSANQPSVQDCLAADAERPTLPTESVRAPIPADAIREQAPAWPVSVQPAPRVAVLGDSIVVHDGRTEVIYRPAQWRLAAD
jgi:hypothetical protein